MTPDEAERQFDAESRERQRKVAAAERAKRERVVETARAAWVLWASAKIEDRPGDTPHPAAAISLANYFERAAAAYVETGSTEEPRP